MRILSHGHLWSLQLLESCRGIGVKTLCIAPGSRSTCLVKAASQIPSFNIITHYDERSLGFFALGCAKYDRVPVVIITTSGSAVANLVPSATEAYALQIPLIYISADRPPELHHCGANQTLEQEPLLKHSVNKQVSYVVNDDKTSFKAYAKSIQSLLTPPPKGPLHINIAFREPFLIPSSSVTLQLDKAYLKTKKIKQKSSPSLLKNYQQTIQGHPIRNHDVLCIVSNTVKPINHKKLLDWSQHYHIPIMTECSSSIPWNEPIIRQVDHVINVLTQRSQLPTYIICIGAKWISKTVQALLQKQDNILLIHDFPETQNCLSLPCLEIANQDIDLTDLLPTQQPNKAYYKTCHHVANQIITKHKKQNQNKLFLEITCIKALSLLMQHMHSVFLGNSLTVRHVNEHINRLKNPVKTITQRGVSGIDGLISTMAGIAYQGSQRTMGIIGDISFFYDVGGLSLLKYIKTPLLLVVINNHGGQIFKTLDINNDAICNPLFVMPQSIRINDIAKAYSIAYQKIVSEKELIAFSTSYNTLNKHHIIECIINY